MCKQGTKAYEQIKNMIFHMEFMPGDKLSELQLSSRLGLSRTPVHDALLRLSAEGLVVLENKRSATVRSFSDDEIRELGIIRLSQDILSAQLASYYGSASDFDRLTQVARACSDFASAGDIYGRIQADSDFHLEISRISRNVHLLEQQAALYQQIHLIQISKYTDVAQSLIQIHHHEPLIEAIRAGNSEEIAALICAHIGNFYHIDPFLFQFFIHKP